jgi:hypothetical protein
MTAPKQKILTYDEVLEILSRQAEAGSVTAAAALERALRARERAEKESPRDDELDRILRVE